MQLYLVYATLLPGTAPLISGFVPGPGTFVELPFWFPMQPFGFEEWLRRFVPGLGTFPLRLFSVAVGLGQLLYHLFTCVVSAFGLLHTLNKFAYTE